MESEYKYQVLVAGTLLEEGLKKLQEECSVDFLAPTKNLRDMIQQYHALIISNDTLVDEAVISAGENLKLIAKIGANLQCIDVDRATEQGITVLSIPERSVISTAEHTISLLLLLARRLYQAIYSLKSGRNQRENLIGVELYGKTLGIVGLGRSGSEVAKRAWAFGMQVLVYDPFISAGQAEKLGVTIAPWEELLAKSDFITIHVPRSPSSISMIGPAEIQKMKRGVSLVNCSHAGLIDEKALYEAIREGQVAGAALDATENMSLESNPLLSLEEVFITPELSAYSREAEVEASFQAAQQVLQGLQGEPVATAVNAPSLPPELLAQVKPFIPLMETLGSFFIQVFGGRIEEIEITYSGQIAEYPLRPLTTALLTGLLRVILGRGVNYVNAKLLAEQRAIQVNEVSKKKSANFSNLVTLNIKTEEGIHTLAGTIFEDNRIRLVQIGDFRLEVAPSQYMLVTRHTDKPGVVGKIGNILGDVNIASMRLGRTKVGGEAVMVLQVDSPVSEEALEAISRLDPIVKASFVEL